MRDRPALIIADTIATARDYANDQGINSPAIITTARGLEGVTWGHYDVHVINRDRIRPSMLDVLARAEHRA